MNAYYFYISLIVMGCVLFVLITVVCIKLVLTEREERIRKLSYVELGDV